MGSISGRLVDCDVTLLSVGGENVLALFREANYEITAEEIDTSAAVDAWNQREVCRKDWRFTMTKLMVNAGHVFVDLIIAGAACVVSTNIGGRDFVGTGVITGVPVGTGNPQTEGITVMSAGGSPTIGA